MLNKYKVYLFKCIGMCVLAVGLMPVSAHALPENCDGLVAAQEEGVGRIQAFVKGFFASPDGGPHYLILDVAMGSGCTMSTPTTGVSKPVLLGQKTLGIETTLGDTTGYFAIQNADSFQQDVILTAAELGCIIDIRPGAAQAGYSTVSYAIFPGCSL